MEPNTVLDRFGRARPMAPGDVVDVVARAQPLGKLVIAALGAAPHIWVERVIDEGDPHVRRQDPASFAWPG